MKSQEWNHPNNLYCDYHFSSIAYRIMRKDDFQSFAEGAANLGAKLSEAVLQAV